MRKLEFRVWIGISMEYSVGVSKYGAFYCSLNNEDTACLNTTLYGENAPVMQFTGLFDKSEKKIWEGDIIRFKSWRDSLQRYEDKIMVVEYRKGFFCPLIDFGDEPSSKDYEVIGNIYENPELCPK